MHIKTFPHPPQAAITEQQHTDPGLTQHIQPKQALLSRQAGNMQDYSVNHNILFLSTDVLFVPF